MTFHTVMNCIPVQHINKVAITSFWWLIGTAAVLMFALPGVTPVRSAGAFVFGEWIPSSHDLVSASDFAPTPAPGPAPATNATAMAANATLQVVGAALAAANSTLKLGANASSADILAAYGPLMPANVGMVTNLANDGWTAMVGILMAQFLILVYDTPAHMAEETRNAGYIVPRAILTSYARSLLHHFPPSSILFPVPRILPFTAHTLPFPTASCLLPTTAAIATAAAPPCALPLSRAALPLSRAALPAAPGLGGLCLLHVAAAHTSAGDAECGCPLPTLRSSLTLHLSCVPAPAAACRSSWAAL